MPDHARINESQPQTHRRADISLLGLVLDHLVDALGGDPSSPIRRAQILIDIDSHPDTNHSDIMARLGVNKSTLNREIEWLYDHGCIVRMDGIKDARQTLVKVYGYAKVNLDLALKYFKGSHEKLQIFIESLIEIFADPKPTLRDAKILVVAADMGTGNRQDLFLKANVGAQTTNLRALENLVDQGLLSKSRGINDN